MDLDVQIKNINTKRKYRNIGEINIYLIKNKYWTENKLPKHSTKPQMINERTVDLAT